VWSLTACSRSLRYQRLVLPTNIADLKALRRTCNSARDMIDIPVAEQSALPHHLRFLAGGGESTRLILERDWSDHPLGEPGGWSEALKATLSTVLNSLESLILAWGRDELTFFFNETYFPLLGPRLDQAMGAAMRPTHRPERHSRRVLRASHIFTMPCRLCTTESPAWWARLWRTHRSIAG